MNVIAYCILYMVVKTIYTRAHTHRQRDRACSVRLQVNEAVWLMRQFPRGVGIKAALDNMCVRPLYLPLGWLACFYILQTIWTVSVGVIGQVVCKQRQMILNVSYSVLIVCFESFLCLSQ